MEEKMVGPLLSDAELYALIDTERYPVYAECIKLLSEGNAVQARKVFADNARKIFNKENFFTLPGKEANPELTNPLKGTAERALEHHMWSCGTPMKFEGKVDWFANPTYNQYKEWTWQLSRHSELIALAKAYRASGDQRYAEGCAELLDSWLKQAVRPGFEESSYATYCWRTIECGIRMGLMWPQMIHTFYDNPAFTDDLIVDYFKSIYEHCQRMLLHPTVGNWLMHELSGLIECGIFYPIFKDSKAWFDNAFANIENEIRHVQVHPDGFQFELTTGYHGVVITHVMEVVEIAEVYGLAVPQTMLDAVENMLMLYVRLMQANGKMPHPNDGGGADSAATIRRYIRFFPNNEYFKWIVSGGKEGKMPEFGSVLLENCGQIALRRDYDTLVSAYFDAGEFGEAHQHEDKLNITICNSEKPVLCEANTYAYDSSAMRHYCLATAGHNCITVNGRGQNRRAGYRWNPEFLTRKSPNVSLEKGEKYDVAVGIYNEGYGKDKENLATQKRTVTIVKYPKAGLPFFIVKDELSAETENDYRAIWHYDTENAEIKDGRFVCSEMTQFILGDVGETKIVVGQTEPTVQGWKLPRAIQGTELPTPTLLHDLKAQNAVTVNVFVLNENGTCPITFASYENGAVTVTYTDGSKEEIRV